MASILNQTALDNVHTQYVALFDDLYGQEVPAGVMDAYATSMPVDGSHLEIDFLSNMPTPRKWIGKKVATPARANSMRYDVAPFEATTTFNLTELQGDRLKVIFAALGRFLAENTRYMELLSFQALINGFSTTLGLTYDGQPLLSLSHPNGPNSGTQANTTSSALSRTTLVSARASMRSFRDENGENLGILPDTLMVGPGLETLAREIVELQDRTQSVSTTNVLDAQTVAAAASIENAVKQYGIKVEVNPRLVGTYANCAFLIDSSKASKPVILGIQKAIQAWDNLALFKTTAQAEFSLEAFVAQGYGHWATVFSFNPDSVTSYTGPG